jgi:hypothetical protein
MWTLTPTLAQSSCSRYIVHHIQITQLPSVVFRNFVDEEVLALSPTALFARLSSLEAEFKERFAAE